MISSLHTLLSKAKSIRQKLSVKKSGNKINCGPKQHFGVSLSSLIESGVISTETKLELQWRRNGEIIEGKVLKNGHIEALTSSGWIEYKSISTAATEIAGYALNGWKHWKVIDLDGISTSLEKVRDRHLKMTPKADNMGKDPEDNIHALVKSMLMDNIVDDEIKI